MQRPLATVLGVVLVAWLACDRSVAAPQATTYALDGDHAQKGPFRGEATVERSGSKWLVTASLRYSSGARETRAGEGTPSGDTLVVRYTVTPEGGAGTKPYRLDARYSLASLDVLKGRLERSSGSYAGSERLRRPGAGLVLVLANRQWEVEHLVKALARSSGRPAAIDGPSVELVYHPDGAMGAAARRPRCRFRCDRFEVEVWCVEDLTRAEPSSKSLTRTKWDVLPRAFAGEGADPATPRRPSVVVTFGSGAGTSAVPNNGSVVVGRRVFVHDPYFASKSDPWRDDLDRLVAAKGASLLDGLGAVRDAVEPDFERPPVTAGAPRLFWGDDFAAIGEVNVEHNDDYEWADPATVHAFSSKVNGTRIGSVDTAHGLFHLRTRSLVDAPCVSVAGVMNRMGKFDELDQDPGGQTGATMGNAARVMVRLIPALTGSLK